ncbi:adhesion G protein-coupled receptor L1-like isoform X2 [Montipora capricornis]|uniref:adhesion G protein-coupled receptor L1-like isoform X2 n=1 Tax=Montipora capricornis TaxID=246305 RepID=UPI0035F200FA
MDTATKDEFGLNPAGIVGCGISLFFCVTAVLAFLFFRPRTEPFIIKQNLTLAVGFTQIALLVSVAAYVKKEGCEAMSVILHFTVTSCFMWCLLDSLHIYFNQTNSSHPFRKNVYYLLFGWGLPMIVLGMSLAIGFALEKQRSRELSLYSCWPSDHIVWIFVIPCMLTATVNFIILSLTLHNLRQPSYDICARAVLERRSTRYNLKTNSILLLSLCLGWLFGLLSFYDDGQNNIRYHLIFGLINGLQGLFLFFFHCVFIVDTKGYYQPGIHRCSHENGCFTDSERSNRDKAHGQDSLTEISFRRQTTWLKGEQWSAEVSVTAKNEQQQRAEQKSTNESRRPTKPDHDALYPSLPGTPEPHISEFEKFAKLPQRKSLPSELIGKRPIREADGLSKSVTVTSLHSRRTSPVDSIINKPSSHSALTARLIVHENVKESHSEPAIPPNLDKPKGERRNLDSSHVVIHSDSRKLSVQSSASTASSERKARKTSRTTLGSSLNELESLFSNPVYMKPHRPSVSSLYGTGAGRDGRKLSAETVPAPGSRTSSQNTEETML